MSRKGSRFMAWLFDAKPVDTAAASPAPTTVEHGSEEPGGREPRWYEREQLGEGNLDEHGKAQARTDATARAPLTAIPADAGTVDVVGLRDLRHDVLAWESRLRVRLYVDQIVDDG